VTTTDGPPQPIDSQPPTKKKRSNRDFWSATAFLWPYRKTVAISILCALLTGALTAGGLLALVPLMNVLVGGGTIAAFADEAVAERQYGMKIDRDGEEYVVQKLSPDRPLLLHDGPAKVGTRVHANDVYKIAENETSRVPLYLRLGRSIAKGLPTDPVYAIATMFGALFVLGIFGSITRFFQEYLSEITAITAINDIRKKLYDRMLHLPLGYFTRHGSSDLTARLVSDAIGLQDGFKTILGKAVQEPINATFALLAAMYIDWRLTFFIIVFTPVMVTVIRKLGKKVRRAARATLERNAAMLGQIESSFVGIRVVKSTTAEPFERRRYRRVLEELRTQQNRMAKYDAWSTPLLEMLGLMAMGCVLLFATWLVFVDRSLKPDELIPLMICLVAIAEPLRRISKLNAVLQKGNAAASRIFEILNEPAEGGMSAPLVKTATPSLQHERGAHATFNQAISFNHLTFSYPGASTPALIDVNLTVPKGTSVAIVGRNGSGKTTLLSLLPRFFEPDSGGISIDGLDVRQWPLRRLRRMIGIVTQEAVLFPGTIGQNIAYADPRIGRDRIVAAAQRAHAHEFILAKPGEYDAAVEGLGGQLSGGQRQRLNIARAILRDTPILILDEATSQIDAESEHFIQGAIAELMKDRTTFVIAHRFSTILSADVIVVMEAGRIVGQGKHEELLATCETYKQLYERQLVG
jgi:ATP-binding cassette, subfamily B, bacterial MsbA